MGSNAVGMTLAGNLAYIAYTHRGLHIVNIADPAHPTFVGRLETPRLPSPAATPNADGSTTMYFAPEQPDGVARGNWIQTVPGKG